MRYVGLLASPLSTEQLLTELSGPLNENEFLGVLWEFVPTNPKNFVQPKPFSIRNAEAATLSLDYGGMTFLSAEKIKTEGRPHKIF